MIHDELLRQSLNKHIKQSKKWTAGRLAYLRGTIISGRSYIFRIARPKVTMGVINIYLFIHLFIYYSTFILFFPSFIGKKPGPIETKKKNKTKQMKTKQNKIKQNKTKTKQNPKQNKTRQNPKQNKTKQTKPKQNPKQNKTKQKTTKDLHWEREFWHSLVSEY